PIHVNFAVPQEKIAQMRAASNVRVTAEGDAAGDLTGTITAIDSVVDAATRNINVQATLPNPQGRVQPGMYVKVQVILPAQESVVALPASAVRYAPYGNSVFIVEE